MKSVTTRLDVGTYNRLRVAALEHHLTPAALARLAIERYLEEERAETLASVGQLKLVMTKADIREPEGGE